MLVLVVVLLVMGVILLTIGGVMLIVAAFRTSVVWGLCVLFLGPASLVYLVMHWEDAKTPFGIQMLGSLLLIGSLGLGASRGAPVMEPMLQKLAESGLSEEHLTALQKKLAPEMTGGETGNEAVGEAIGETGGEEGGEAGEDAPPEPAQPEAVDARDPKSFEGATLAEARTLLGRPKGEMKSGSELCLLYDRFTVFSADGKTISHVEMEGGASSGAKPQPAALAAPSASAADNVPPVRMISNGGQRVDMKSITVPGKVTVVDFYADWVGPCKIMGPKLEQIARTDPDVMLCKIDVVNWQTPVVAQFKIRSIPYVQVYDRNGTPVGAASPQFDEIQKNIARAK